MFNGKNLEESSTNIILIWWSFFLLLNKNIYNSHVNSIITTKKIQMTSTFNCFLKTSVTSIISWINKIRNYCEHFSTFFRLLCDTETIVYIVSILIDSKLFGSRDLRLQSCSKKQELKLVGGGKIITIPKWCLFLDIHI